MKLSIKYFIFISILFLEGNLLFAQNAAFLGSNENDVAFSITKFENKFYIAGTTCATDKSPTNFYVLELNENGSLKNKFIFGNTHRDIGKDILVNSSGIFVLGKTWDGGFPNNDMVLNKLDFKGRWQWEEYYGGHHNDLGHKFIFTKDGGFAMAGFNRSIDDFGDAYLVKADKDGKMIWENHFGDRFVDHAFDVVETDAGNFIVVGTKGGFFNPTSTDFLNHDADIYIIKTNANGEKLWEKTYGGQAHDWAKEIIKAPGGGYYVCGSTQSVGAGSFDFFLMKIDADGNELWFKTYGGKDFDYGESVGVSKDNNLYILGSSASYSDNFKTDFLLLKLDLDGEKIREKQFGGTGSDYAAAMVCTPDSGCAFTGWTDSGEIGKKDIAFYKVSKDGLPKVISNIQPINDSIEQIKIYPNPVKNKFSVIIDSKISSNFQLKLYNAQGALVYTSTVEPNILTEHQPQFRSGLYLFIIQHNGKTVYNGKLVFQ